MKTREEYKQMCDVLGVNYEASINEIKKRYHQLVKENHPDKVPGKEELFKKISNAYQYILDFRISNEFKEDKKPFYKFFYEEMNDIDEFRNYLKAMSSEALYNIVLAYYLEKKTTQELAIPTPYGFTLEDQAEDTLHNRAFYSKKENEQQLALHFYMKLAQATKLHPHLIMVARHFVEIENYSEAVDWYKLAIREHDSYSALEGFFKYEPNQQAVLSFLNKILNEYSDRPITKNLYDFYQEFEKQTREVASFERRQFLYLWKYAEFFYNTVESKYYSGNRQSSTWTYEEAILHPSVGTKEAPIIINHLITKGHNSWAPYYKLETLAIIISKGNENTKPYACKKYLEILPQLSENDLESISIRCEQIGVPQLSKFSAINDFILNSKEAQLYFEKAKYQENMIDDDCFQLEQSKDEIYEACKQVDKKPEEPIKESVPQNLNKNPKHNFFSQLFHSLFGNKHSKKEMIKDEVIVEKHYLTK